MKLRARQVETCDKIIKEFSEVASTLVVYPTGCGKTVMFADIIRRFQPMAALVVAERRELIWQARDRIRDHTGIESKIEMGELSSEPDLLCETKVVISTIQTLTSVGRDDRSRMSKFDPMKFGLLVIDECHHSTADSYKNVINYFRQNADLRILGVTATPDRADEEALGQIFETVADEYEIEDAIDDGWLVDIKQRIVRIEGLDFAGMRTQAGDLNSTDLSKEMERESNLHGVVQPVLETMHGLDNQAMKAIQTVSWGEYLEGLRVTPKRTLVFTVSVEQAELLAGIFNRVRRGLADWICGATNEDERRERLGRFREGVCPIMVNCGVLIEGYDHPEIEIVAMARPTKSRSRYAQMIGRALRPLPNLVEEIDTPELRRAAIAASAKPCCIVLDFVGNSGRHKLVTTADILAGKVSDAAIERANKVAEKLGRNVSMRETLKDEEKKIVEEAEKARQEAAARKAKLMAKAQYITKNVNPFDVLDLMPAKARGWDGSKRLSEKQRNVLLKQGINPDSMPYTQGRQILLEIFRRWDQKLCTYGQAKILKKRGLKTDVSKEEASRMISEIAARENWKPKPKPQMQS